MPKALTCPHCRKSTYMRKLQDTLELYLWHESRAQEPTDVLRLDEEDYEEFLLGREVSKRSWIAAQLRKIFP